MIDPKRLTVQKRLTALLQTVTLANGYQHDLSVAGRVTRGRLFMESDSGALPAVAINEPLNPDREASRAGAKGQYAKEVWRLLVQGWAVDDLDNPTDPAHWLMADVKKALATINQRGHTNYQLGGLVDRVEIEPGTCRPPQVEVSPLAFFYLHCNVVMVEDTNDPYGS